jgi:two-component system, cell cycle response regulator
MYRQKVLVIDDSPLIHRLVRTRLSELGVEVLEATHGQQGLALARQEHPDLILLDVEMPVMNGFEACQLLKHDPATHDIPVIFLTGADEAVDKVRGFDLGAVDYVTKPFDLIELRARVRAALNTKTLMDLLTSQAQLDGLTGLRNRRYFDERLHQELAAARRYGRGVGLVLLDLDYFKAINDTHGHPKGDQVLRKIAELLITVCRASDVPCRYGGEEFAVILPESNPDQAFRCGQRIINEIRQNADLAAILRQAVTVSIGTACTLPADGMTAADLVETADKALYHAKASGRNRVGGMAPRSHAA